jgi:hypothetical protein
VGDLDHVRLAVGAGCSAEERVGGNQSGMARVVRFLVWVRVGAEVGETPEGLRPDAFFCWCDYAPAAGSEQGEARSEGRGASIASGSDFGLGCVLPAGGAERSAEN